jgi:hypothetical protein
MTHLSKLGLVCASLACLVATPCPADQTPASVGPRRVLAFYYAWYGNPQVGGRWRHWENVRPDQHDIASAMHYPQAGAYDSADPKIIDQHMGQMAEAGIDGPILSWWGTRSRETDHVLPELLDAAARHGRVVSAYYETIGGADRVSAVAADLGFLVSRFGAHPAWLKVEGRPVIFVYGRALGEMGPIERWNEVRERVRKDAGIAPFLVGDRIDAEAAAVFDGIHTYNTAGMLAGKTIEQVRRQDLAAARLTAALAHAAGRVACMTIIPGYDDTKIRTPGLVCARHDGATYQAGWDAARAGGCDWAVITSWNEWHEGSEIEPSFELGERDWKATRPGADRFRAGASTADSGAVPEAWRDYVRRWTGGTIGLLDVSSPSSIASDLMTCGLPYRLVNLREVATGTVTAQDCPILAFVGGEPVHTEFGPGASLEAGLKRYERDGGVLVLASWEPWPFHRSLETGERSWLRHLGMTLGGGFEKPPTAGLRFRFTGPLAALGERPFPTAGDLRFRPCLDRADERTRFDPMAVLQGPNGQELGPAIALLVRTGPDPVRMIYVWEGMWDVAGRDALLRSILDQAVGLRKRPDPDR